MLSESEQSEEIVERYHYLRGELLKSCESIQSLIKAHDEEHILLEELTEIQEELDNDTFKIGLFGVTAAGKSTLINALMRDPLLREGMGETTRTLTIIRYPDEKHPDGTVEVIFKNIEQINKEVEKHLFHLGFLDEQSDENTDNNYNFEDSRFQRKLREFSKKNGRGDDEESLASRKFVSYLLEGWKQNHPRLGTTENMSLKESDDLVHNSEADASYVAQRIIYHDCPITKEKFTFIDAPGVGSALARHTDEAVQVARSVDVAILVTKVDYKFMPADRKFLKDAMDVQRMEERHNLLFVLNQIGRINPMQSGFPPTQFNDAVEHVVKELQERLAEENIKDAQIKAIDAACGQWSRCLMKNKEDEEADEQLSYYDFRACRGDIECNLKMSRIEQFESYLRSHLTDIRYIGFLGSKKDRLHGLTASYKDELEQIINEYGKKSEELELKLKEHEKNQKITSDNLNEYLKYVLPNKLKEKYPDIEDKITEIVDNTADLTAKHYIHYMDKVKGRCKRTVNRSKNNIKTRNHSTWGKFWEIANLDVNEIIKNVRVKEFYDRVVMKTKNNISPKIQKMRDEYEGIYEELKNEALNKKIPDIVSHYGKDINFTISKVSLTRKVETSLKGLEGIQLTLWQGIRSYFSRLKFKSRQDWVKEKILENYKERFQETFREDISGWVSEDMKSFTEQIEGKFNQLMDKIENRIKKQIYLAKENDARRAEYKQKLENFVQLTDEELSKLSELDKEIKRVKR